MLSERNLALLAAAALVLAGCAREEMQRNFGLSRDAPDEFTVTTQAPLSIPPEFALRPPRPGAPRPQDQSTAGQAEATLVPQTALEPPAGGDMSPGQQALVAAAGPPAPPGIRRMIDSEAAKEASSRSLTDRLMFWKTPSPVGTVVDPQKESQRLREDAALGKNPDVGETPIIQNKPKTILDVLF